MLASYIALRLIIALIFLVAGAWFDWKRRTIPNWFILVFGLVSLLSLLITPYLQISVGIYWGIAIFLIGWLVHKKLHFGIGDVAICAILGLLIPEFAFAVIFIAAVLVYVKKILKGIKLDEPFLVYLLVAFLLVFITISL